MSEEKFADSCSGCQFATFKYDDDFLDQNGCEIGRLQKYLDLGLAKLQGGAKSAYQLKKRCNYKLAEDVLKRKCKDDIDLSVAANIDRVRSKQRVKTAAIIFVKRINGLLSFVELDRILATVTQFQVGVDGVRYPLYEEVILLNNKSTYKPKELQHRLETFANATGHKGCRLVHMIADESDYVALDEAVSQISRSHFYTVITSCSDGVYGGSHVATLPARLNYLVNEQVSNLVAVAPHSFDSLNGLTVHTMTHRRASVGGNAAMTFDDAEGRSELVYLVSDKLKRLGEAWEIPGLVADFSVLEQ